MMGLVMRICNRKQCRRVFWRLRAAVKKAVQNHHHHYGSSRSKSTKRQFKFQYDPCSYALNFDDGIGVADDLEDIKREKVQVFPHNHKYHPMSPASSATTTSIPGSATTTTWVYVIWLGPFQ